MKTTIEFVNNDIQSLSSSFIAQVSQNISLQDMLCLVNPSKQGTYNGYEARTPTNCEVQHSQKSRKKCLFEINSEIPEVHGMQPKKVIISSLLLLLLLLFFFFFHVFKGF